MCPRIVLLVRNEIIDSTFLEDLLLNADLITAIFRAIFSEIFFSEN